VCVCVFVVCVCVGVCAPCLPLLKCLCILLLLLLLSVSLSILSFVLRRGMVVVNLANVQTAANNTLDRWITVSQQKEKDEVSGELHVRVALDCEPQVDASAQTSLNSPASADQTEAAPRTTSDCAQGMSGGSISSDAPAESEELVRLRRENLELRANHAALQSRYDALEQRYNALQKNLISAKLSPRPHSPSIYEEKERGIARFTDEQREIARVAFQEYDKDGNGSIDQSELIFLMEELRRSKVLNMSDSLFKRYVRMNWKAIDTGGYALVSNTPERWDFSLSLSLSLSELS
jgi:EF hand